MKKLTKAVSALLAVVMIMSIMLSTPFTVSAKSSDTVYVNLDNGWSEVYCYMWSDGTTGENAAWPGVPMTYVGGKVYSYTLDNDYKNVIFNNGNNGSGQTNDLEYAGDGKIYTLSTNEWSTYDENNRSSVYDKIYIAGNGDTETGWMNGACWNDDYSDYHTTFIEENVMTEISTDMYSITFRNLPKGNDYQFKFVANADVTPWEIHWGYGEKIYLGVDDPDINSKYHVGAVTEAEAVYNSSFANFIINNPYQYADVTIILDLTNFNYSNKTGAKVKVALTEIDYQTFIQKHIEFIGAENDNNTYHNLLAHFDLSQIALEDYEDLEDTYNLWRAVRGEIFENPYYVVLADMIMGERSAQGQIDSFDANLENNWLSLTNDVIELVNSKVELTSSQESKIKNMFRNKDFSDKTTFKLLEDIFGSKVSQDELNSIFNAYDKTNTFIDIFNDGANIVNSVIDTINYSAILKSYEDTSDEFKVVLMQVSYCCQMENPWLYTAIDKYLNSDYDTEMRKKIIEEVAKNGLDIGETLFKEAIVNKVKNFLINNMDLSKVGTKVASGVLAFVQGAEIGKSIGIGIDNILFGTDDVTNSYVTASATAKTAGYLRFILENNESALRNNPTVKNTCLFCESFNMYKNIQLNVADTMITYFSKNQCSLINKIFQSQNILYETQIYNWQILKLNWQGVSCHQEYMLQSTMKNITVACPVNVTIYNQNDDIVLNIVNNEVLNNNGEIVATVCNNIKYITLPDDSYNVKITATDDGIMSYSVSDFNVLKSESKTVHFENIQIRKGNVYSGEIISGNEYKQDDIALYNDNKIVDSQISIYTDDDKIEVSNIELNSSLLSLSVGETDKISATIAPQNASNKSVTWYSENPEIAQVDEYGNITAISSGKTKIVCVSLEGNIKSECDVEVENLLGDINGDDSVTVQDVTLIQKYLAEFVDLKDEQLAVADTNGDGDVNIQDATQIQKYITKLVTVLG